MHIAVSQDTKYNFIHICKLQTWEKILKCMRTSTIKYSINVRKDMGNFYTENYETLISKRLSEDKQCLKVGRFNIKMFIVLKCIN